VVICAVEAPFIRFRSALSLDVRERNAAGFSVLTLSR